MPDGYIKVYQSGGRMIAEHRLVLQQHLGRELRDDELVHHIDGNKSNNDIANLQVVSAREHSAIHLTLKDRWAKEHDRCVECGTTERRHLANGLCFRCHNRNYARQWRRERRAGYYAARFGLPDDRESVLPNIDALIAMGQGREE